MSELTAEQVTALAEADAWADEHIETWSDIYAMFHEKMHQYHQYQNPNMVIAVFYSFILALEEMPEEGDAKAIVKRMNYIMMAQPERTGMEVMVIKREDVVKAAKVMRALGGMPTVVAEEEPEIPAEEPEASPESKKHLH